MHILQHILYLKYNTITLLLNGNGCLHNKFEQRPFSYDWNAISNMETALLIDNSKWLKIVILHSYIDPLNETRLTLVKYFSNIIETRKLCFALFGST